MRHRRASAEVAVVISAAVCVVVALLLVGGPPLLPQARAQTCQIQLSLDPTVLHYPFPLSSAKGGPTFGEIIDVNYSVSLTGQTVNLEYSYHDQNGSHWAYLQSFTANSLGFTETSAGINSGWAVTGSNTLRAVASSCISPPATFSIVVDGSAISADILIYAAIALLGFSFFLIGRRLRFGVFLALAAAVYLALAPFTGQRYDVFFLLSSGMRILQHVNPFDPGNPPIYPGSLKWAYPPLYAVYSSISFAIYRVLTGTNLPSVSSLTWPGFATSTYNIWEAFVPKTLPSLVFILKLPMVASALATAILLQKMTGGNKSVAVFWLVNPLVILVAAIWGQLDPIATFLALASVYYYTKKNKPYHAYLLASFGAAIKVWPVLLIPLFLASSLRRDGRRAIKPLSAVLPALGVSIGLYAAYGNLLQTLFVFIYARGIPTYAGEFSVNGLTWQQVLVELGSPPVPLFLYLGIPLYILVLVHIYRSGDANVAKWTVVSILIFFLTYNYVNPQYFYWILPFLIVQGRKLEFWLFTALPMAYMVMAYNVFYFVSPALLIDEFSSGASILEQMKVTYFYSTPWQFILVSAAVPTAIYLLLLSREIGRPRKLGAIKSPAREGLAAQSSTQ